MTIEITRIIAFEMDATNLDGDNLGRRNFIMFVYDGGTMTGTDASHPLDFLASIAAKVSS